MVAENIDIRIREDGARVVRRSIEDIGDAGTKSANGIDMLKRALAGISAGLALREFTQMLDVTTNINNRLRLVTSTTAELNAVYDELLNISNETRTSIADNADIFGRLAIATESLGLTYREQLDLTKQLNQALIISGASAQEGGAALRQLGQALGAGKLSGDEFVSVNENLPRVMQAVADSMGVTRGELKELSKEGKITAEVLVEAMSKASGDLALEFAKIAPTISGAFTVLNNAALNFIRDFNEGTAVGEIFANTILFVAQNFEVFAAGAAALGIILVGTVIPALLAMTAAMLANPIGLIAVSIAAAVVALSIFGETQLTIAGQTVTVWQTVKAAIASVADVVNAVVAVVRAAFNAMLAAVGPFFAGMREWLSGLISDWSDSVSSILGLIKTFINSAIGLFVGLVKTVSPIITEGIPAAFRLAMALAYNAVLEGVNNIVKKVAFAIAVIAKLAEGLPGVSDTAGKDTYFGIVDNLDLEGAKIETEGLTAAVNESRTAIAGAFNGAQIDYVGAFGNAVAGAGATIKDVFTTNLKEVTATTTEGAAAADLLAGSLGDGSTGGGVAGAAEGAGKAAGGAAKGVSDMNDQLERQKQILDDTVGKRQEFIDQLTAAASLLSSGQITAGDALGQVINTGLLSEDLFEGTQDLMNMRIEQFRVMYEQINLLRQQDLISEQTARQAMAQVDLQYVEQRLGSQKAFFGELSKLSRSGNRTVAAIGKAAAVTQATIDGYLAIQKALASHPPPMNYAIAAAIGATTAANIAGILSQNTNFATGGSFVVPGTGGVDSQMVAMRASPGERVSVQTPTQVRKGTAAANAGMGGGGAAPQVNQRIINVVDPAMVGDFLSSPEGEEVLVNIIGRSGIMGRSGA